MTFDQDLQYENLKWAIDKLIEIAEEHYSDYDTDSDIEEIINLYEYYYD